MRGGSLQALKEILGHSSLAMVLRYAHLAPEHVRGEMKLTAKPASMAQTGHTDVLRAALLQPRVESAARL